MSYTASEYRYDKMVYRRCGKSGMVLPALSLGMWQNFGSESSFDNSREIVLRAFDLGIYHYDLANNYGPLPGTAEETLGKLISTDLKPHRDEIVISTKAGYKMWDGPFGNGGSKKYLLSSLDQSLKRMQVDYVDIFYSHRPDPKTPLEETMEALATAVRQGKALYVGISNYSCERTKKAVQILNDMGVKCLIHQPRYSMLDRWIECGLTNILEREGMGSIAFSPLEQGLLTSKYSKGIPVGSRASQTNTTLDLSRTTPQMLQRVQALSQIAQQRGQSLAQMSLAWVLLTVTSALIGVSSVAQLEENVAALEHLDFSLEELTQIESVLTR